MYRNLSQIERDEIKREYMVILKERPERVMTNGINPMVIKPANFGKYALTFVWPMLASDFPHNWPRAFRDIMQLISESTTSS